MLNIIQEQPTIYLVGIISPIPKDQYNVELREIVKDVIIRYTQELEEEGVNFTLPNGQEIHCRGTIHSILGDHMGQIALSGIGGPTSNHGSV